ncbi:hypothetical protein SAMN04488570_3830 [Nocardioides scoriae]|uniref:Uncharacterized protein n=1 Tax=Nocardioides scoriae TaxID=642780 RepID=A0A1H1YFH2_9ACTN|nr:hypothetical protein SAMN04488570_3830 [Nocardioides scoriae]
MVGGVLVLLGAAVLATGLFLTVSRGVATDAVVLLRGAGRPVGVGVPVGEERMVFVPRGEPVPDCAVTTADGTDLALEPTTTSTTVTTMGRTWVGVATFTSPSAEVRIGCASPVDALRVGSPLGAGFAVGLVATVLGSLLLGGSGLAVLVTTLVLWLSRPPRSDRAPAAAPGPPSSPPPAW